MFPNIGSKLKKNAEIDSALVTKTDTVNNFYTTSEVGSKITVGILDMRFRRKNPNRYSKSF